MRTCRNSVTRAALVTFFSVSLLLPCFASFALDGTFGGGGKVTIAFPDSTTNYSSSGLRIFIQPGGRIVALGTFTNGTPDGQMSGIAGVGLTTAGTPDFSYATTFDWQSHGSTSLSDALMYADGRILRLSRFFNVVGSSTVRAARVSADGSGDTVFGSNAIIGASAGGFGTARASQISVRSDGKVLVLIIEDGQYFLYRLNADGTRDTTFGANGVLAIQFNKMPLPSESGLEMVALPDGKVLLAGHVSPFSFGTGSDEFFLARLTEYGGWDKTFGRVGFLKAPFGGGITGRLTRATVQPDGNILLCGMVFNPDADTWMMRFRSNGRVDTSFGTGGAVISDFLPGGTDNASAMALSPDGKVRIVGSMGSPSTFLVARFSANGSLEDNTSIAFTDGQHSTGSDIALQPDGKVMVIGATRNPNMSINGSVFAIARLTE